MVPNVVRHLQATPREPETAQGCHWEDVPMCLAVPARVVDCSGDEATVDLQGNTLKISKIMTPEVTRGDWVLVHAGFAIAQLDEADARETWDYLRQAFPDLVEPPRAAEVERDGP